MGSEDKVHLLAQFKSETGDMVGSPFDLPVDISVQGLQMICNALLQKEGDEVTPYTFFVNEKEVVNNLEFTLKEDKLDTEKVLEIIYQPQAVFRVRAVTRCTSSMPGHAEAVISALFSPDGRSLASGSGDTTVRFWDINTETPHHTCKSHKHWVLCVAWSPDGRKLASADKNGMICIWDPDTGKQIGKPLTGHKQWVTFLAWEPMHLNPNCRKVASSSKDGDIKIWDAILGNILITLSGHKLSVTCIRWGANGLLYSSSQDRTIKLWRPEDGILCRTLEGHAHWVNSLALSTDYVLRTGAFDPREASLVYTQVDEPLEVLQKKAQTRVDSILSLGPERLVSGSDDFTLFLWSPTQDKKPRARLTGHQQLVNDVKFSPDSRIIASASFDKSIKLWDGFTGKFLSSLRGHVQSVYQIAWSADSRLLVSGSADSTLKVWSLKTKKIELDLPGHADEIYAVDWSPDGQRVVSGGKDKVIKIWRH
ncbi:notchless protein homolog 1-like isoform X2 [Artemia franciscana]|nr:hypothetical protein QYM36_002022 [Artemia franciscana]KAK2723542.1 hypothetical protein QYM36_002022 [Artemia franciscana]